MVQQVFCGVISALEIVAADRDARLPFHHRAPSHEVRALRHQLFQPGPVFNEVPITQKDDAVGLLAVFVCNVPIAG